MNSYFLYLLPLFSVLFGYAFALFIKPKTKTNLKLLLAFSGSFLLSLTVMHLLPELYVDKNQSIGLFIMLGILFQIVLEFFSKGAEHGHVHGHGHGHFSPRPSPSQWSGAPHLHTTIRRWTTWRYCTSTMVLVPQARYMETCPSDSNPPLLLS